MPGITTRLWSMQCESLSDSSPTLWPLGRSLSLSRPEDTKVFVSETIWLSVEMRHNRRLPPGCGPHSGYPACALALSFPETLQWSITQEEEPVQEGLQQSNEAVCLLEKLQVTIPDNTAAAKHLRSWEIWFYQPVTVVAVHIPVMCGEVHVRLSVDHSPGRKHQASSTEWRRCLHRRCVL